MTGAGADEPVEDFGEVNDAAEAELQRHLMGFQAAFQEQFLRALNAQLGDLFFDGAPKLTAKITFKFAPVQALSRGNFPGANRLMVVLPDKPQCPGRFQVGHGQNVGAQPGHHSLGGESRSVCAARGGQP